MESYDIQHDFLFASDDVATGGSPRFDDSSSSREKSLAVPVKASSLMGPNGEKMLDAFAKVGKPIILIDDLPTTDNPIVLAYSSLLIKGIVAEFHKRRNRVFEYGKTRDKSH